MSGEILSMPKRAVRSGDLLIWSRKSGNALQNIPLEIVKKLTKSKYGHVAIAWRLHDGLKDELFVVEATIPQIRITRVNCDDKLFCVPMGVEWTEPGKEFLVSKVGLPYSLMDGLRAVLGYAAKDNDRWQCAELSRAFYKHCGIDIGEGDKPEQVIENCMKYSGSSLYRIQT